MNESVLLDFIDSHASNILAVEEWVTAAYDAVLSWDDDMDKLREEGRKLQTRLGEMAARNCSFRRKDFNALMDNVLSRIEREKEELFEERRRIKEALKEHLEHQRKLALSLKDVVAKYIEGHMSRAEVESFVNDITTLYKERGEEIYRSLRAFQYKLHVYKREVQRLNEKLRRLVERGDSLKAEDLRQLEAAKERSLREGEQKLRQEEVRRMLLHFKQGRRNMRDNLG